MKEEWRECFGGAYEASSLGRIRRKLPAIGTWVGRILKQFPHGSGYWYVVVCVNRKKKGFLVHQLVAEAFLGPCPKGKEVNHKDLNKLNNRSRNLEYKTHVANLAHAKKNGHGSPIGELAGGVNVTKKQRLQIERLFELGDSKTSIAKELGFSTRVVKGILDGTHWSLRKAA